MELLKKNFLIILPFQVHKKHKSHRSNKASQLLKDMMYSVLVNFVYIVRLLVDKTVDYFLELYLNTVYDKKRCPDLKKDFFITKSGVEIAELIRNEEITCYQVVNAYINRIIETNPILNAVIDGPFIDALDEASQIDTRIKNGIVTQQEFNEKPFLGID